MLQLSDFHKTYIIDHFGWDGSPASRVGLFNQNIWRLADIQIEGKTEYTHSPNDRLYFMPGVTTARMKVRDFLQRKGGAIVKEPSRATVIFYSEDTLKEMFSESGNCLKLSKNHYLRWLKVAYTSDETLASAAKFEQIYREETDKVNESESPFVLISSHAAPIITGRQGVMWYGNKQIRSGIPQEHFASATGITVVQGSEHRIGCVNSPLLCHQNGIIKHLNTTEITEHMYEELRSMLSSTDGQSVTMAIEIMANCDYDKSVVYLLVLLKDFMPQIGANKGAEQVNFKTMLAYIDLPRYYQITVDDIGKVMSRKGQNTRENRELMMRLVAPSLFQDEQGPEEEQVNGAPYEDFPEDDVDLGEEDL